MQVFIFAVGLVVSIFVVYGIFSQVPGQIRKPEKVIYRESAQESE